MKTWGTLLILWIKLYKVKFAKNLLKSIHTLGEYTVPGDDHDDWNSAVHQCQGTMLQFTWLDTLAVHVGQLFYLYKTEI